MTNSTSNNKPTVRSQLRSLVVFVLLIVGAAAASAVTAGLVISQVGG